MWILVPYMDTQPDRSRAKSAQLGGLGERWVRERGGMGVDHMIRLPRGAPCHALSEILVSIHLSWYQSRQQHYGIQTGESV